jgi:tetratricopeptide (TPR) repeat protein
MTSPIQGLISPTTGLFPALREIVGRAEHHDGILRIEGNNEITGDVALTQSRYITGAYESSTGTKGVQALTKLLALRKGSFKFIPTSSGFDANLQQTLKLDVKKLVSEDEAEDAENDEGATGESAVAANAAAPQNAAVPPNSAVAPNAAAAAPNAAAAAPNASVAPNTAVQPNAAIAQNALVALDASADTRGIMIPQFSTDAATRDIVSNKQLPAPLHEKPGGLPQSNTKKSAGIHVSRTKADMDGHYVYADMEEDDDLFSLLEHFGLSVEQPLVERLYEPDATSASASRRGPTADIMRRAAARLHPPDEPTEPVVAADPSSPAMETAQPSPRAIEPAPHVEVSPRPIPTQISDAVAEPTQPAPLTPKSVAPPPNVPPPAEPAPLPEEPTSSPGASESPNLAEEQTAPEAAAESALPAAGTAAAEGAEVGTWAARVLLGQEGQGTALAQTGPTVVSSAPTSANPTSSGEVPKQTVEGTTLDTTPSREETWTERVIAAARKAKGTITTDDTKSPNADKVMTNKIDVDQSASMRLKFHGKAPQPNLPDRLQKGSATFWSKHRVKLALACTLIGIIVTALIVERSILSLIYTRKAEERLVSSNYGAAMNDVAIALFFDSAQEPAHYLKARVFSKLGQEANALAEYNIVLASDPTKIEALERRAAICVTLGDFHQTLDDCNQLLKLQKDECSVYVFANRGIANYMLGNREEAVKDFTAALKMKGKDEALLTRRGATYSLLGQLDNAIKDYDTAIKLYPKSAEAYAGRAQCWLRAKKFSNAFADFDRAVKLNPINAALLTQRGASYATTKQYDRANKDFTRAIAINPRYAGAYRERARINILQHQFEPAEADMKRAAEAKTPDSEFYKQRAELYELMDNHAKARNDYSDALSLQPNDVEALIGRARNLSSLGNQRAAMADIDEALKLAPAYSQLYALRGLFGDRYGNTSTAKTDFDKAIALAPGNAEAHLWRGDFLLKQKDFISASEDFDQALKLNPDLVQARQNKILAQAKLPHTAARVPLPTTVTHARPSKEDQELLEKGTLPELVQAGYQQMRSGNNERAMLYLERAVRLNPNDASARRYLAHTFLASGDVENAIAQFQMVDKLGQPNADDIKALADALAQTSRTEDAITAYNRCLQLRPNDVPTRCTLARLYASSGFLNKAKEICLEGLKNSSDSADLNVVLKEIQTKATRQRTPATPSQEQRPNTEG